MEGGPIIVGYDGSTQSEVALQWALDEGVRCGSRIAIAHVITPTVTLPGVNHGNGPSRTEWEIRSAIERIAREAYDWGRLGIDVSGEVFTGPVASALCEQSRGASMVVLGTRGLGGFSGLRIGSEALKVAAHAHCPVVVIRESLRVPESRPIAVGVDTSAEGRLAVGFAFEEAARRRVALMAIRGCEPPRWPGRARDDPRAQLGEKRVAMERRLLDAVVASWHERYPEVRVTTKLACATPAHALTVASRDCQLLVIGSQGAGGSRLGSVCQQLLNHSLCSMVVVHGIAGAASGRLNDVMTATASA